MKKHQRRILITNFCVTLGILLIFVGFMLMNIFGFCISNKNLSGKLIFISSIFAIWGFILLIIATRINANLFPHFGCFRTNIIIPPIEKFGSAGVPNNPFSEFDIPITNFMPEVLLAKEVLKGIYEIQLNEKKYIFDMQGWVHKKYYIYEIILTKIQIKFIMKNNVTSLCSSIEIRDIKDLELNIIKMNGKKKTYLLIKDGKTQPNAKYKHNLKQKINYFKNKKNISIESLYDFNR